MPKNRKMQNIIGVEHIRDAAELAIAAQASAGVGGSDTQIQYNNGGSIAGISGFTFTDTSGSEQVILSETSDAALFKIEQKGTGACFQVHDQASDTSILQVNAGGTVAIGHTDSGGGGYGKLQVNGVTYSNQHASLAGSASGPGFTFGNDQNTGMFSGGTDIIGFSTGGTERLAIGAAGEVLVGGTAAGTSGQVLTSGGDGAAVSWTTAGGGASPSSANDSFDASFSAIPLHALRPWGTSRSSTGTQGLSNPACRPFIMTHEGGTVNTMYIIVTGGSSGSYRAGIYSDDSGKPGTLLGQADFAYGSGTGVKSATSFFAADGTTSKTITLVKDTQYWMAFVKVSGNLSIRTTDPGRTPHIGLDENANPANSWYISISDTTQSNTFEDTWDYANSDVSVYMPGSMWLKMN